MILYRRKNIHAAVLVTAALVFAPPAADRAFANDTSAELTNGGLVFVQNADVEMRAEDLFISAAEVRVRYRFFNKSQRDVTTLVAFPMPEIRIEHQDQNISVPTEDPVNILAFETRVDGKPVAAEVEQRVFSAGVDRTAFLRKLGIPLAPHLRATNEALDRLPRAQWDELIRIGLAEIEEYDAGKGMETHLSARWALQTTYYWLQNFPARSEIVVEHRYKPSVGGTAGTSFGSPYATQDASYAAQLRKYCVDKDFLGAIARAMKTAKPELGVPFAEQRIEYVLKTGANWSGPIGDFRLVIDKGEPDNLVSFCGENVRKIGPTQFEMKKKDFIPDGNLSIVILQRVRN